MRAATIRKEITIHAPAAQVWQWVGTEAGLRQWWQMDVALEAKSGGRCRECGLLNGVPYQLEGIVTTYDPPRQLAFLLAGAQPGTAWPTTMNITITLEEVAGTTVVRVVHQLSAVQTMVTPYYPEPVFPQPLRQRPTILNQLPGQPQPGQVVEVSKGLRPDAGQALVDQRWISLYEAHWSARLISLLQLTKVTEEHL